ncbi:hypothetical protein HY78_15700 [Rhizorhabdus wittichii DC-6]|nr:hypothetical protein HY78_15700 [Rhizorhabdus wittichii DC-6]
MRELAEYIGAANVLLLCDRFGGQAIYIPARRPSKPHHVAKLIGEDAFQILIEKFASCRLQIATAHAAIRRAKRASVIAAARAGQISISTAAIIIGSSRPYTSELVNNSTEGFAINPGPLPRPRELGLVEDAADIAAGALIVAGAEEPAIQQACQEIVDLWLSQVCPADDCNQGTEQ